MTAEFLFPINRSLMFGKITVFCMHPGKLRALSHHIFPSLFTALIGGYVIQIYYVLTYKGFLRNKINANEGPSMCWGVWTGWLLTIEVSQWWKDLSAASITVGHLLKVTSSTLYVTTEKVLWCLCVPSHLNSPLGTFFLEFPPHRIVPLGVMLQQVIMFCYLLSCVMFRQP